MQSYLKIIVISFIVCCIVRSEILTGLWLLSVMVPVVKWFLGEAAKRQ